MREMAIGYPEGVDVENEIAKVIGNTISSKSKEINMPKDESTILKSDGEHVPNQPREENITKRDERDIASVPTDSTSAESGDNKPEYVPQQYREENAIKRVNIEISKSEDESASRDRLGGSWIL